MNCDKRRVLTGALKRKTNRTGFQARGAFIVVGEDVGELQNLSSAKTGFAKKKR